MKTLQFFANPLVLASISATLFFTSCGDKNKEQVTPEKSDDHSGYVIPERKAVASPIMTSEKVLEDLRTEGMAINPGSTAMDISGEYQVDQFMVAVPFSPGDPVAEGIPSHPYRIRIVKGGEHYRVDLTAMDFEQINIPDASISGSGTKFTLRGKLICSKEGESYQAVISGQVDDGALKGLEFAVIRIKAQGNSIREQLPKEIQFRVWKSDRAVKVLPTTPHRISPPSHVIFRKGLLDPR